MTAREEALRRARALVAIDPATDNVRARRAYEKAGFRLVTTEAGRAVLMLYEPAFGD